MIGRDQRKSGGVQPNCNQSRARRRAQLRPLVADSHEFPLGPLSLVQSWHQVGIYWTPYFVGYFGDYRRCSKAGGSH
jgi:hypothetical protein